MKKNSDTESSMSFYIYNKSALKHILNKRRNYRIDISLSFPKTAFDVEIRRGDDSIIKLGQNK